VFIIHRIVFVLNLIVIALLLASYAAPYVSPGAFWPLAFAGIGFPFLLLINFVFIIYWTIFFKLKVLFPIAAIALGYPYIQKVIRISPTKTSETEDKVKILNFNCRSFGYFDKTVNTASFFELMHEEQPDIVCFQEFFSEQTKRRNYIYKSEKASGHKHYFFTSGFKENDSNKREFGLFISSRYPIIDTGVILFPLRMSNRCQWATLKINEDTVRVYNLHLESNHFDWDDYKIMETAGQDTTLTRAGNILSKLKKAWVNRSAQAQMVAEHIQSCPYPVFLCGDFNDTPVSYTYRTLTSELKDAFVESGSGISQTYSGPLPSFRIDYITGSKKYQFMNYEVQGNFFSDHKVLTTLVNIKK
jgi:endonuclease/exonuclease/phosphatase family metal-dependent hydrolase